ncbi:hypothetical protein ACXPWS_15080 [Mycobacterium sp. BMJ-28]
MRRIFDRSALSGLAVVAAVTGGWAYFAPRSWYDTFPGMGMSWLPPLGPYNEHFCKDTGAMFLALFVLSVAAIGWLENRAVVRIVAGAWLTFNVLHWWYHMTMLHMYSARDAVLNAIFLSLMVLASAALLMPSRVPDSRTRDLSRR